MIRDICLNGGYKSKHSNEEVMMKLMRFGFDTYGKVSGWLGLSPPQIVRRLSVMLRRCNALSTQAHKKNILSKCSGTTCSVFDNRVF